MSYLFRHPIVRANRRPALVAVVLAILGTSSASVALAAGDVGLGRATGFRSAFTTKRPGSASGLFLRTTGKPPRSGVTEAPAVRQTVVFPAGTRLRLGALPQCHASAEMIAARGAEAACPASSRVGAGGADGILQGKRTHFDIGIYAVSRHLVFAAENHGKPLKQAFLGVAKGARLVLTVPTLGGMIAPTGFAARIRAGHGTRAWLRTPSFCPRSRTWKAVGRFQGVSAATPPTHPVTPAQTLTDKLACRG